MFTTDVGDNPTIERFNMDGTDHRKLVTKNIAYPDPITVDPDEELVFWFDYFKKTLFVMDLDGGNRRTLEFENKGSTHLFSSITIMGAPPQGSSSGMPDFSLSDSIS